MDPTKFLYERNRFVLILFTCSFAILTVLFYSDFTHLVQGFPIFPMLAFIWCLYSCAKFPNHKLAMRSNLVMLHIAVFIHASMHITVLNVAWLAFICFLATLYYSFKSTLLAIIVTIVECTWLFTIDSETLTSSIFLGNMLFLALCIIISNAWHGHVFNSSYLHLSEQAKQNYYLHMFFEQANDAIAVVDLEDRIIDMNPAFEKLYGWNRDECIGEVISIVPETNRIAASERFERLKKGESISAFETVDLRQDGSLVHVQLSMSPIYNKEGDMLAISIISQDITYKKNAEKRILQSEKLALAGEIAAGVAHEIRNPLTAVSGFIQMMNEDKESPYYTYTQIIQSELERINLIISEFLVLSKPHIDDVKKLSITNVCLTIATFLQFEFQSKNIQFTQCIPQDDYFIWADENQIKQVLLNILRNAIEAVHDHGQISLSLHANDNNSITIQLKDDGIGMDASTLAQIFDPFFTTKENGTGLGMMLTSQIIRSFNGNICIDSSKEAGTTVEITFPIME